ncbi:MAG TPA: hypothetical protein DCX52_01370 [Massilia sp.]|nr:hypothetical protein [Massilia sp.]
MNILIFAPLAPQTAAAAMVQALVLDLVRSGHTATLIRTETEQGDGHPTGPGWQDEAGIGALAAQADLVVYQLGAASAMHAGAHAWLRRLPGVFWLLGEDALAIARACGPWALGILADDAIAPAALLPYCPGPVLGTAGETVSARLLQLAATAQRMVPVRAAVDELTALLRAWGADDETVRNSALADGFDLFEA